MGAWRWAAAACRGVSHERSGIRAQDAYVCLAPKSVPADTLVAAVSDGAGSASYGGEGAWLTCRTIAVLSQTHFRENKELPNDEVIHWWLDVVRDRVGAVASRLSVPAREFAGTLVALISAGESSVIFHVGDGCAVVKDATSRWVAPIWPDHGEYASTTSFVTDDQGAKVRIARLDTPIHAAAIFSDGLERLALQFSERTPFQPFFDGMMRPLLAINTPGRDRILSHTLRQYLGSDAVNQRTDDDKSLILAVRS